MVVELLTSSHLTVWTESVSSVSHNTCYICVCFLVQEEAQNSKNTRMQQFYSIVSEIFAYSELIKKKIQESEEPYSQHSTSNHANRAKRAVKH